MSEKANDLFADDSEDDTTDDDLNKAGKQPKHVISDNSKKAAVSPKKWKKRKHGDLFLRLGLDDSSSDDDSPEDRANSADCVRAKEDNEVVDIAQPVTEFHPNGIFGEEEERPKNKKFTRKRKKNTLKRFKTDPNESGEAKAQKSLLADTLFGSDVVSVIFSFLDARQLLRFLFVSKEFKNLLTYDHVIRSTMLSGGFPMMNLEKLAPPIRQRKIFIPSPLRLLRTVCGKRCENCDKSNRFVCDAFGVFWCRACLNKSTKLFRRSKRWKDYLDAPRVSLGPQKATAGKSEMYLMLTPVKDVAGHPVGPLVTAQDLETIMAKKEKDESTTPAEKVAAWMQKCDDQQPRADAAVKSILKALGDNRQDADNRRTIIREEKEEARRKNSDKVIANLTDLLRDADPDIIAELNTRQWKSSRNQYTLGDDFSVNSIVQKLLAPVFQAPSKYAVTENLQPVVDKIRLLTEEKKLAERYIQQIVDHCDHPGVNETVLERTYNLYFFSFEFHNIYVSALLNEPLRNPRSLTDEHVQHLANEVKKIVQRKALSVEILRRLQRGLEDLPYVGDLMNRTWYEWGWYWRFNEDYIRHILEVPISHPEDIGEEEFNELEETLRLSMETKKRVVSRMELLLAPIEKLYPSWYSRLEQWKWDSRRITFYDYRAREIFGDPLYNKLKHVEQMDDGRIGDLSIQLMINIAKHEGS